MFKVQRRRIQDKKWITLIKLSGFPLFHEVKPRGFTYKHYLQLKKGEAIAELCNSAIWLYRIKNES